MTEPRKRTALTSRVLPTLSAEEEAFLSAISAPQNAHIFSLEAVSKAYANTKRLSTDMTKTEREYLTLWIANDLASLLLNEPGQSEQFKALMTELEHETREWVAELRRIVGTDMTEPNQRTRALMGKSVLRVTTVAAARALMTQDMLAGHRETPDVGTPRVKVTVHAPKVAAFLERRNLLQSRERKVPKLSACAKGVQTCDVCVYKQYEAQDGRIVTSQTCARCGASSAER